MSYFNHHFSNLFPKKWDATIFCAYLVLFVNQGLLVTGTKTADNKYTYNIVAAVLMTECIKLVVALSIYLKDNSFEKFKKDLRNSKKVFALYLVPAFLYCLYNNLAFINLQTFDPTTYYLLLQFRVVITAVIYQFLFSKQLSMMQWFSLVLLTCGCLFKNMGHMSQETNGSLISFNMILVLVQVFCSCFAGVYNEYLLKGSVQDVDVMIQNFYMYTNSILCNVIALYALNTQQNESLSIQVFSTLLEPLIIAVLVNNAFCGIITSIFLKNLNSILKTFASAIEPVFIAILSWIIFGIQIDIYTVIAIIIVSCATYLYSTNPVVNRLEKPESSESTETLLTDVKVRQEDV